MKYTFTAHYMDVNNLGHGAHNPLEITLWMPIHQTRGMARIHDKANEKTTLVPFEARVLTVHRKFYIQGGHTIVTAEDVRNRQRSNPNVNYGSVEQQTAKELLSGIQPSRDLMVDSGTFEKIVSAFKWFPDEVEELLSF